MKGAAFRRRGEFPQSALVLSMILGTAVTLWNVRYATLLPMRITRTTHSGCDEKTALLFAPGMYNKIAKKVISGIQSAYRNHRESILENAGEPKNPVKRNGGQAHLGHEYFHISPPGTRHLTRWSLDARLRSYVEGSVAYDAGALVVNENGYYFVYSQVSFVKALRDLQANQTAVMHELIRFSAATNEAQTLLRTQKTHCWDQRVQCSLDASYLGATFYLQKGDRILAVVSDANFMWQSPRRTYLGMRSL